MGVSLERSQADGMGGMTAEIMSGAANVAAMGSVGYRKMSKIVDNSMYEGAKK